MGRGDSSHIVGTQVKQDKRKEEKKKLLERKA
jgi:hypothetical protein